VKKTLTDEARKWLTRPVSSKEIKIALFQMSSEKAPGPDGFNGAFYQKQCDILGKDIISAVQSFYVCGKLLMDVNHTFLTLISKVSNSSNLTDFMPISCYNVLYKVISKTFKQQTSNSDY